MSTRRVSLVDLGALHEPLHADLSAAFQRVLRSSRFVLGEEVAAFEQRVAEDLGARCAVGTSSGSDALLVALAALGVGAGDEVVVPAFSFFASVGSVLRLGAVPRFCDVEPDTLTLDPGRVADAVGPKTRAIVLVHLYGQLAAADHVAGIARAHGVALVEDAAQAFGARGADRAAGRYGQIGVFSFFPSKPLGAFGDGGLLVTDDEALAERCRAIRQHGARERHRHVEVGGNFRLDALQAALLSVKLPHHERWRVARLERVRAYEAALRGVPGLALLRHEDGSAASLFTVRVLGGKRDAVQRALAGDGVETAVHYPTALHQQPALGDRRAPAGAFPHAEAAAQEVLSLPLHPTLGLGDVEYVCQRLRAALGS